MLVATALETIANTSKLLTFIRERAQKSRDADLKVHINTLYDNFLSLKEVFRRLTDENSELRNKLAELQRPPAVNIRQVGLVNYYYVGDEGPYCQPCYDGRG